MVNYISKKAVLLKIKGMKNDISCYTSQKKLGIAILYS